MGAIWGSPSFIILPVLLSGLLTPLPVGADETDYLACRAKCQSDTRNKENDVTLQGTDFIPTLYLETCNRSCTMTDQAIRESESKEWDPNHPVVQKCFAESGVSDKNQGVKNYVTNNCIMEGIRAERQNAQRAQTQQPTQTTGGQPQPATPPCETALIESYEKACFDSRTASMSACDESKMNNLPQAPPQANGSAEACSQAKTYHSQVASTLEQYVSQCQNAKAQCSSACGRFAQEVRNRSANCSAQITSSYHNSAAAMMDLCNGMGARLNQAIAQKEAARQAEANAGSCERQVAASSNPEGSKSGRQGDDTVDAARAGQGPQENGLNTASGTLGNSWGQTNSLANLPGQGSKNGQSPDHLDTSGHDKTKRDGDAGGTSMSLAALPVTDLSSLASANAEKTEEADKGSPGAGSSAEGGGGGRTPYMLKPQKLGKSLESESGNRWTASSDEKPPDLSAFLPKVGGMKASSFDGHGPHADLFEKISQRYKLLETSLIKDLP